MAVISTLPSGEKLEHVVLGPPAVAEVEGGGTVQGTHKVGEPGALGAHPQGLLPARAGLQTPDAAVSVKVQTEGGDVVRPGPRHEVA